MKRGRGRPKGSKNKPKKGRPRKHPKPHKKRIVLYDKDDGSELMLPLIRDQYNTRSQLAITPSIDAAVVPKESLSSQTQDQLLDAELNIDKFTEQGFNNSDNEEIKEINEDPVDASFYYRGAKNIPVAGAQYSFTADMVLELQRCRADVVYFAENFFFIVTIDKGKQKIKLYEAQRRILRSLADNRFVSLLSARQTGKALALDTPIRTTNGWTVMGNIKRGDFVYGTDGKPIEVTHAHEVLHQRECYKVTFDTGETIIADSEHEWFTQHRRERQKGSVGSVKTTKQIYDTLLVSGTREPAHRLPICKDGLKNEESDLPIEPYILGYWLGDGSSEAGSVIVGSRDLDHVLGELKQSKQFDNITTRTYDYCNSTYVTISVSSSKHVHSLSSLIRREGLYKNKHIPESYFSASRDQKIALLKGLMDSDGYIDRNGMAYFNNSNEVLTEQVHRLVTELGYKATVMTRVATLNGVAKKVTRDVVFKPEEVVVTIPFKRDRLKISTTTASRARFFYIKNVELCESVPVRCITVDSPDSLYLAGRSLIPTHNSTLLTIFVLWMVCFNKDYRAAIVANKETTAINIFKRIRLAYEQLPNYIKPGVKDYAKTGMTLENDSSVIVSTTTATSIRGDTLNCLAIDEAAFIESHLLEEFWASVIPSVSSGLSSKILMVSTPNGVGNKFYEIYTEAEKKANGWVAERVDWWDVPGRDEAWKKTMISALGSEEKFHQEFGNSFLDNNVSVIGAALIEKLKREKKPPVWTSEGGEYTVFAFPDPTHHYVIGVDVGEGIGRAASVAQVLDITDLQNIEQVAVYSSSIIEPYHFANKLNVIGNSWGVAPMLIERNNCGAQVIDALYHKHQYEKLISYSKISESEKYNKTRNIGVLSHTNIRFDGVQNLRYWVNHLQVVRINDSGTISELETFVRHPNGIFRKKTDVFFDDRVMSLTWALFILEPEICQQYFEITEFDLQHKPLKIASNGFWETVSSTYDLRDVGPTEHIIQKPGPAFSSLNISNDELADLDKYELDMESLESMGYSMYLPDV